MQIRAISATIIAFTVGATALGASVSSNESKRIQEAGHRASGNSRGARQGTFHRTCGTTRAASPSSPAWEKGGVRDRRRIREGLMSCRHAGVWSAPVFMQLGKGSWGLQIGAQSIDLVLLVMNNGGIEKLLQDK